MAHRALIEHRPWLLASVASALAYYFLWNNGIGEIWLMPLKGAGAGLLAIYAYRRARGLDAGLLILTLVLASAGDMAIILFFEIGGALFAASHLAAIWLFLRNRLENAALGDHAVGASLLFASPFVSYVLSGRIDIAAYALVLGAMSWAAWVSCFPRSRVGIGVILFIASDWLLFSRLGPYDLAPIPDIFVWPIYYAAQLLIATGIVQALRSERSRPD